MWIYLCKNVHPLSTKEIIATKMCKEIYSHEQCVVCVTLKIQAIPHFSHDLLGLVHSGSILQCPFSCFPSLLGMYVQLVVCVHVGFPHCCLWETSSPIFLIVIFCCWSSLFSYIFFIGDGASSLSSSFVNGHHVLSIVLSYWWLTPLNEEGKKNPKMLITM